MNQNVQQKIEQYKRLASDKNHKAHRDIAVRTSTQDSLGSVIRSKKDADIFMAELDSISRKSK